MIKEIIEAVTIPVMAKVGSYFVYLWNSSILFATLPGSDRSLCRSSGMFNHVLKTYQNPDLAFWQILQAIGIDYIDESEVLTPADEQHHINKHNFKVPFVCGCKNLGEALRRIAEGAAFIRTKGEAGTGNVVEAVRHERAVMSDIRRASAMSDEELYAFAKDIQAPFHLLKETARLKRLPVVNFAAGGIATPADAALMMQLGCDGGKYLLWGCIKPSLIYSYSFRRFGYLQGRRVIVNARLGANHCLSLVMLPSEHVPSFRQLLTSRTPKCWLRYVYYVARQCAQWVTSVALDL